jgi:hypothetical protein
MTCARETAKHGGSVVDHKNVCGAVCAHAVPVKGVFISSPANENFMQYVALLAVARVGLGLALQAFLLDINCQFSKHLKKNAPGLAVGVVFYIGWLHARAGHNLECQLEFNAQFGTGLGRCIGEFIEQLWVRNDGPCRCLLVAVCLKLRVCYVRCAGGVCLLWPSNDLCLPHVCRLP